MRLGIVSDTHNQLSRLRAALKLLHAEGADTLIHCGDLTSAEIVRGCAGWPSYFVFGNNDADNIPALEAAMAEIGARCLGWSGEILLAGKRVAVVHGHLGSDVRRLLATQPDYLFSGHSHIASDQCVGPTRRINPGALHRAEQFTIAVLDMEADELCFHTIAGR